MATMAQFTFTSNFSTSYCPRTSRFRTMLQPLSKAATPIPIISSNLGLPKIMAAPLTAPALSAPLTPHTPLPRLKTLAYGCRLIEVHARQT